jgi:hypothetical protein
MSGRFDRHQDNEEFVNAFRKALVELPDRQLLRLISEGQFKALGNNAFSAGDSHNNCICDNCYSGDTECDGIGGAYVLGDVWMKTAKNLKLNINRIPPQPESDAEEETDYSDTEEEE